MYLYQILTDLKNNIHCTFSVKVAINRSVKIPPNLKYVSTLPCEILMLKNRLVRPVRYGTILVQRCMNLPHPDPIVWSCQLGTRRYNFTVYIDPERHNAQRYRRTDVRRDRWHYDGNSRSYCVTVRSATTSLLQFISVSLINIKSCGVYTVHDGTALLCSVDAMMQDRALLSLTL